MKGYGERISTAQEFPNVAVYRRKGPVYTVAFRNKESVAGTARGFLRGFIVLPLFIGAPLVLLWGGQMAPEFGYHWGWGVLAAAAAGLAVGAWALSPARLHRAIELDFDKELFRVYCAGRLKLTRPLGALVNLTVDDHPQAELERQRKRGEIGQFQKQHCLYGWFGPGGANRTLLLCRWEWPSQERSLFEVQQAIHWAIAQQAAAAGAVMPGEPDTIRIGDVTIAGRPGLAPPLD